MLLYKWSTVMTMIIIKKLRLKHTWIKSRVQELCRISHKSGKFYIFFNFLTARELISRWRDLSNSSPKSHGESRSKMPTNMASKFLKFVCRKCCVDRLRFQNIHRLNGRPCLFLLDLKEKCTRYAGVPTSEADLFDRNDHRAGQST